MKGKHWIDVYSPIMKALASGSSIRTALIINSGSNVREIQYMMIEAEIKMEPIRGDPIIVIKGWILRERNNYQESARQIPKT